MKEEFDCDVRLNAYGEPDVDYYIAKARQMRAELFIGWFSSLKSKLVKRISDLHFGGAAPSH